MSGIICKVWNISASSKKKNENAQIGDSINYILNDEKTEARFHGETYEEFSGKQLDRECKYVENDVKTMEGAYVGYMNLASSDTASAVREMMDVKKMYGKLDGRAALHGIISLPVEESSVENAGKLLQMCEDVLHDLFPEHQAVFAVHTNTENLHVHFIVNSVGLNGKKIHQPRDFMDNTVHPCINKYAEKYGFLKNEQWERKENDSEKKSRYVDIKIRLREKIDRAIEKSDDFEDFVNLLREDGLTVNIGKHISLRDADMGKAMRTYQLGSNYSKDAIIERISTRKLDFENLEYLGRNVSAKAGDIVSKPGQSFLKKYSELSREEKREVIRKLKLGENPWKARSKTNWQMKRAADQLNTANRIHSYIREYSHDGTMQGALDGIIRNKQEIQERKREIKRIYRKYKPLTDLYFEMREIENKAYLYEHDGKTEYRVEYENFRELTRRMRDGYGRGIDEVAEFIERYENQLLYANSQLEELSEEYRDIKKYSSVHGLHLGQNVSLIEKIGFEHDRTLSFSGMFEAGVKYYASRQNPDVYLKVVKSPYVDEHGKTKQGFEAVLMARDGEVIERLNSRDGISAFSSGISDIQRKYRLNDCEEFSSYAYMKEFCGKLVGNVDNDKPERDKAYEAADRKMYSFTQAVNQYSIQGKVGAYVICNSSDAAYFVRVDTGENAILAVVMDANGRDMETHEIPLFKDRNEDGYKSLQQIKEKFGFSDNVVIYGSFDDAKTANRKDEKTRGRHI